MKTVDLASPNHQDYEYYQVMGVMYSMAFDLVKLENVWTRGSRNFEQLNVGFRNFLRTFDSIDQLPSVSCPNSWQRNFPASL